MILAIRARTTVDHKEALVVEDTMETPAQDETVVEEDMETEEAMVVVAEEETLAMVVVRGEMNGITMEEEGKELVVAQVGVEVPVVAEELHQEDGAVVVQVGPKILLLLLLPCTRSNF